MKTKVCLLLLIFTFLACIEKVRVPPSDDTPPTIDLSVVVQGQQYDLTAEGSDIEVEIGVGDEIGLLATAEDPEGVKDVGIIGGITCRCLSESGYAQSKHLDISINNQDPGGVGDMALVKRLLPHVIRPSEYFGICPDGYWLTGLSGDIAAYGANFHNGFTYTKKFIFELDADVANLVVQRPLEGERFVQNETVRFEVNFIGPGGGGTQEIRWYSSLDGELGAGHAITISELSVGTHEIEAQGLYQQEKKTIRVFDNLESLYHAPPSDAETERVKSDFTFQYLDRDGVDEKWVPYDNYDFDQTSTEPNKMAALARLDVFRHQQFSEPLPFTNGLPLYDHLRQYLKTVKLRLDCGNNSAGGDYMNLTRPFNVWDKRYSSPPDEPNKCKESMDPPQLDDYLSYIVVHEARHLEPGDPGHRTCNGKSNMDPTLEGGSGHAQAGLYLMWVYKYGKSDPPYLKDQAKVIARSLLQSRFCATPTHSNPKVQAIVDELLGPNP